MSEESGHDADRDGERGRRLKASHTLRYWTDPGNIAPRLTRPAPVTEVKAGPATAFQVDDVQLIRKVAAGEDAFMSWTPDPARRDVIGAGPLGSEGEPHRERRTVPTPAPNGLTLTAAPREPRTRP